MIIFRTDGLTILNMQTVLSRAFQAEMNSWFWVKQKVKLMPYTTTALGLGDYFSLINL